MRRLRRWFRRVVLRRPVLTDAELMATAVAMKRDLEEQWFFGKSHQPQSQWWNAISDAACDAADANKESK